MYAYKDCTHNVDRLLPYRGNSVIRHASKPEIADFQIAVCIDANIGRLEIPVNYLFTAFIV